MKKTLIKRLITFTILIAVLVVSSIGSCYSATLEEIEKEIKNAENQKGSIEDKLDSLANKKKEAANKIDSQKAQLSELEKQKQNNLTQKELIIKDVEHMYEMLLDMSDAIDQAQKEYDEKSALFKERVKVMYQYSDYSFLQILVESDNLLDLISKVYQMATLLQHDVDLMNEVELLRLDLAHKKSMQEVACANKEAILAEKEAIIKQLEQDQTVIESKYLSSRKELENLLAEEDKLLEKSKEIEKMIKDLQKESEKIKYEGGKMIWPAEKGTYISSYWGMRLHPIYNVMRMHQGIDIPAPGGSNILAANGGTVIVAAWDDGYGNYIIIDHGGGITTVYAHSSKLVVKKGDKVQKGQVIAKVGTTGTSTGNHLHFEVRVNGESVNPLNYVKVPS